MRHKLNIDKGLRNAEVILIEKMNERKPYNVTIKNRSTRVHLPVLSTSDSGLLGSRLFPSAQPVSLTS